MVDTTIKLSMATKESLDKLKVHPRQSYAEVIVMLINKYFKKKE